jgi:hypothetical protein
VAKWRQQLFHSCQNVKTACQLEKSEISGVCLRQPNLAWGNLQQKAKELKLLDWHYLPYLLNFKGLFLC